MLLLLDIHNIALIEKISIEFGGGLNILTGETGAGKSIIIDSINAVLGERVSRDIIRTGAEKGLVEAVFKTDSEYLGGILSDMGISQENDGTLILSREITQSGRNTCRVNSRMVTASDLRTIGELLMDLHGQHDNQSLLNTENHIELLDAFGGESIQQLRRQYLSLLDQYKEKGAQLKAMSGDPGELERKIDLLKFQIDEIEKAKLKAGEEEELVKQRTRLASAEKISEGLSIAYALLLSGGQSGEPAANIVREAISRLNNISGLDEISDSLCGQLQDLLYQLEDICEGIRRNNESMEYDPELQEKIGERLDLIFRLKRKYGGSVFSINEFYTNSKGQLDNILKSEENILLLNRQLEEMEKKLYEISQLLNKERKKAALVLENSICSQLKDLEMQKSLFKVGILFDTALKERGERKFTQSGLDKIEFLISTNPGEPLKPLAKIASGGEMSRMMLAIKTILAEIDRIPTMIFDEIDMGIGGKAAQKVGEKLALISLGHQVICVTHLAQIACMADNHYLIKKIADKDITRTYVSRLDNNEKVLEIARLIGGAVITDSSLKYSRELISNARKIKKL